MNILLKEDKKMLSVSAGSVAKKQNEPANIK